MIDCLTLQAAQSVPNVVHIYYTGTVWRAYQEGDAIPGDLDGTQPTAAELLAQLRTQADAIIDGQREDDVRFRADVLVSLDEFNSHKDKINAILSAVAAASTLADLKTRVAAIGAYPLRTIAQYKTAMKSKIDAGDADS